MEEPISPTQKCIDIIEDRVLGVSNDLKAFIYIRKYNLQHKEDDIGGGNIVVALSLFTTLNFLGKAYYCTVKPAKFEADGSALNETETFIKFMKFLQDSGLELGLSSNGEILELVWNGFRNYLAHRLTVEPGKSVLTFEFKPGHQGSIEAILEEAKQHQVFEHNGQNRDWIVNGDALLANLPEITQRVTEHIRNQTSLNTDLLLKVIGIEYP